MGLSCGSRVMVDHAGCMWPCLLEYEFESEAAEHLDDMPTQVFSLA